MDFTNCLLPHARRAVRPWQDQVPWLAPASILPQLTSLSITIKQSPAYTCVLYSQRMPSESPAEVARVLSVVPLAHTKPLYACVPFKAAGTLACKNASSGSCLCNTDDTLSHTKQLCLTRGCAELFELNVFKFWNGDLVVPPGLAPPGLPPQMQECTEGACQSKLLSQVLLLCR